MSISTIFLLILDNCKKENNTYVHINFWGRILGQSCILFCRFALRVEKNEKTDDLIALVEDIVPYFVENNAEHDAIDLLLEVDRLAFIKKYVNEGNFERISLYLQ